MDDGNNLGPSPGEKRLDGIEGPGGCGVSETQFPFLNKCCDQRKSAAGTEHARICVHCSIWASLPDSASLERTYVFECCSLGYSKRIKERNLKVIRD
jgi:hypothetical protein